MISHIATSTIRNYDAPMVMTYELKILENRVIRLYVKYRNDSPSPSKYFNFVSS